MSLLDFFKKNESNSSGRGRHEDVQLRKIIAPANYTPVDYVHTPEYVMAVANTIEDEKQIVKSMNLDDLNAGWREPLIESDSAAEISFGKRQFINHVRAIEDIIDLQNGELTRCSLIKNQLESDYKRCGTELESLYSLKEPK